VTDVVLHVVVIIGGIGLAVAFLHRGGVRKSGILTRFQNRYPGASLMLELASPDRIRELQSYHSRRSIDTFERAASISAAVVFTAAAVWAAVDLIA
jgi:hypothetical protein